MNTRLTTILFILGLMVSATFSHAAYKVSQLTTDAYDDFNPQINADGEVVYEKQVAGDSQIYLNTDGTEGLISSDLSHSYNPQINNYGNVIWESDVDGYHKIIVKPLGLWYVPLYPKVDNNSPQYVPQTYFTETFPQFNDNLQIAWTATSGNSIQKKDELWLRTGPGNTYKYFPSNCFYQELSDKNPQINNNGVVVWQRADDASCDPQLAQMRYAINLYDSKTPNIMPINISQNLTGDNLNPQINDHGTVVWENDGDIYRYTGGEPEKISDNPEYENTAPQIINQCGFVVWEGCKGNDCEIFLFDGYDAVNISNDPYRDDEKPQINERGQVVWEKNFSCLVCLQPIGSNKGREIMLYHHSKNTLVNLSDRDGDDRDPQINGYGEVVWSGHAQGDWEIFKAVPWVISSTTPYGTEAQYAEIDIVYPCYQEPNTLTIVEDKQLNVEMTDNETSQSSAKPTKVTPVAAPRSAKGRRSFR